MNVILQSQGDRGYRFITESLLQGPVVNEYPLPGPGKRFTGGDGIHYRFWMNIPSGLDRGDTRVPRSR